MSVINENGEFFSVKKQDYDEATLNCITTAVNKLENLRDKPLMMLGKIQSGKTKSFIGVIALAFDNGYDFAIVLTKNSKALVQQTVSRLKDEFKAFAADDVMDVFDIMAVPPNMTRFELDKKIIMVVKKEKTNIPTMKKFIKKYGIDKKCLIIDDEADYCSIGYSKDKEDISLRKIASEINELRIQLTYRFIQVTATPYSLYLQPDDISGIMQQDIKPIKPANTVLVPCGEG